MSEELDNQIPDLEIPDIDLEDYEIPEEEDNTPFTACLICNC